MRTTIAYIPSSHLDLFWLGNYKQCLDRGADLIKGYLDRCAQTPDETFVIESAIFAQEFLRKYPEYRLPLVELVGAGRVEVSAAYIDRKEHLPLAESHVRNMQLGQAWHREVFGHYAAMAAHPDLPSLVPQMAQLYTQAGVRAYTTARKVHEYGAVWRYHSPDGTRLLFLSYPVHYSFSPLDLDDIPNAARNSGWLRAMDVGKAIDGFPLGTVPVPGGAGDLADRGTFHDRYGRHLEEFVADYRERHPDMDFCYTTPSAVLEPYRDRPDVPEHAGEVLSVWGIGIGEDGDFYARDRRVEGALLTAETAAAVAEHLNIEWRPESATTWRGLFDERAYFARKDPIPRGKEFAELWRMHVFVKDHNSGGEEGTLTSFQKRVRQDRCLNYAQEIIEQVLGELGARSEVEGDCVVVFNPHGRPYSGPVTVGDTDLFVQDVPAIGYQVMRRDDEPRNTASPSVTREEGHIQLQSADLRVTVDTSTGAISELLDLRRGHDWGGQRVGRIYALRELANDVVMKLDPTPLEAEFVSASVTNEGPSRATVRIRKRLLSAEIEQTITLWSALPRVDLETRIYWWGAEEWQIREALPSPQAADRMTYGSPFYACGWAETMPGASPRNPDEVAPDEYLRYREIQGWLHLDGGDAGLTMCTVQDAFHYGDGLEAILLRTPPSCGDPRLHWKHAGDQRFRFTLLAGEPDWRAADAPWHGAVYIKPPVALRADAGDAGQLPANEGFLEVSDSSVMLSSLQPDPEGSVCRIFDAMGTGATVRLSGPLAAGSAVATDLLGENPTPLADEPSARTIDLAPWRIQTIRLRRP